MTVHVWILCSRICLSFNLPQAVGGFTWSMVVKPSPRPTGVLWLPTICSIRSWAAEAGALHTCLSPQHFIHPHIISESSSSIRKCCRWSYQVFLHIQCSFIYVGTSQNLSHDRTHIADPWRTFVVYVLPHSSSSPPQPTPAAAARASGCTFGFLRLKPTAFFHPRCPIKNQLEAPEDKVEVPVGDGGFICFQRLQLLKDCRAELSQFNISSLSPRVAAAERKEGSLRAEKQISFCPHWHKWHLVEYWD